MIPNDSDQSAPSPKPPTRRLFLAITLAPEVREVIADLSQRLQKGARFTALQASWVPPENFHMTLHFMGPVEIDKVAALETALRSLQETFPPFQISLRGLGYFPHDRAPRVLWLGVPKPLPQLNTLLEATATAIQGAGHPLQHDNFHPHITLARFKSLKGTAAFVNIAKSYRDTTAGECDIRHIVLMESLFTRGAPEYNEVAQIPLSSTQEAPG